MISPLAASQTITVESVPPHARRRPSGLNATLITPAVGSRRTWSSLQFVASQIFTDAAILAEANRLPSRLKVRLFTSACCSGDPFTSLLVFTSQSRTVASALAEATCQLFGLQATERIAQL